eukprot:9491875-Pyramimonas_sp.AAC.1
MARYGARAPTLAAHALAAQRGVKGSTYMASCTPPQQPTRDPPDTRAAGTLASSHSHIPDTTPTRRTSSSARCAGAPRIPLKSDASLCRRRRWFRIVIS